jgi:flagellar basal-body rod modification protein FlgD
MSSVSANYTMPTILNTLQPAANSGIAKTAGANAAAASSSSSTSSSTSASGLGSTFLSLLAQELENQDPTAPVDPTAMVGQMISLNQLEQLISINQSITGATTATGTANANAVQAAGATASNTALASTSNNAASTLSPSAAAAATSQLPFDPNTMMPLGFGNTGAMATSINSSINPTTMGFSGTSNNTSGGK